MSPSNGSLVTGTVTLANVSGAFQHNSVAYNIGKKGNNVAGVTCTAAAGVTVVAGNNIVAGNTNSNNQVGAAGCDFDNSYINGSATAVQFTSMTDLHLTAASPMTNPIIRDDPRATAQCQEPLGTFRDDLDGELRPVGGFCDLGADEYKAP